MTELLTHAHRHEPGIAVSAAVELMTGGEAVAHAMRQVDPGVVSVYPITPQTPIIEAFARFVADGRVSTEMINAESEHSAMSAALGAALAGTRAMTATASQGLALMIEVVYLASSMRAPIVMAVGNRALSGPINIHCDHSDAMLARDAGAVQLFAADAQEAYDLTLLAVRLAEHPAVRLPVMVNLDGFTVTHLAEPVGLLDDTAAKGFVGEPSVADPLLERGRPTTHGGLAMPEYYYEFRRQQVAAVEAVLVVWDGLAAEYAAVSGRGYGLLESHRMEDAERAVLLLGSSFGTLTAVVDELRADGERVGALSLRSFRPFPAAEVRRALARVEALAVLDRAVSPGGMPPLFAEVAGSADCPGPRRRSYVYGLGGRDLTPAAIRQVFAELREPAGPERVRYLGLRG